MAEVDDPADLVLVHAALDGGNQSHVQPISARRSSARIFFGRISGSPRMMR